MLVLPKVKVTVAESMLVTPSVSSLKMSAFKRASIFSWLAAVNQVVVYVQRMTMVI